MLKPVVGVLKAVGAIAAGVIPLWHLTANSAQAVTLTYDMTVDVTQGNYQGTYQGSFSYDASESLKTCQDSFVFTCATVEQNNLSVLFNFLGKTYSENHDRDYELDFPAVYFQDNALAGLSLVVTPPTSDIVSRFWARTFTLGLRLIQML